MFLVRATIIVTNWSIIVTLFDYIILKLELLAVFCRYFCCSTLKNFQFKLRRQPEPCHSFTYIDCLSIRLVVICIREQKERN